MNATNEDKGHNGWTNYETWAVNLWLNNTQGDQDQALDMAREAYKAARKDKTFTRRENAAFALADSLKTMHEETLDLLAGNIQNTVYADLLNAAMGEVNWHEIAKHFIDAVCKEGK